MIQQTISFRTSDLNIDVERAEKKYNATFVGDFCVKGRDGSFIPDTAAIFWQETPPVEGYSNYFALFRLHGVTYITSGQSAFDSPITAVVADDGEIVYSRHRHDYRTSKDGSVTIDGGRDYVKLSGTNINAKCVRLVINGPTIEVHESEAP